MINTTTLRLRIAKYLAANSGGKKQTGETSFGIAACGEATVLMRMRNGAQLREPTLRKMDSFLRARGY